MLPKSFLAADVNVGSAWLALKALVFPCCNHGKRLHLPVLRCLLYHLGIILVPIWYGLFCIRSLTLYKNPFSARFLYQPHVTEKAIGTRGAEFPNSAPLGGVCEYDDIKYSTTYIGRAHVNTPYNSLRHPQWYLKILNGGDFPGAPMHESEKWTWSRSVVSDL